MTGKFKKFARRLFGSKKTSTVKPAPVPRKKPVSARSILLARHTVLRKDPTILARHPFLLKSIRYKVAGPRVVPKLRPATPVKRPVSPPKPPSVSPPKPPPKPSSSPSSANVRKANVFRQKRFLQAFKRHKNEALSVARRASELGRMRAKTRGLKALKNLRNEQRSAERMANAFRRRRQLSKAAAELKEHVGRRRQKRTANAFRRRKQLTRTVIELKEYRDQQKRRNKYANFARRLGREDRRRRRALLQKSPDSSPPSLASIPVKKKKKTRRRSWKRGALTLGMGSLLASAAFLRGHHLGHYGPRRSGVPSKFKRPTYGPREKPLGWISPQNNNYIPKGTLDPITVRPKGMSYSQMLRDSQFQKDYQNLLHNIPEGTQVPISGYKYKDD